MATIPVDIRTAPLGDALAAIYDAVLSQSIRIEHLESIMADLTPALDRLEAAVAQILPLIGDNGEVQAALDAERAANAALVQAAAELEAVEAAEDVTQNADLAAAVEAQNSAVAATDAAFTRLEGVSASLEAAVTPDPADPNI